MEATLWEAYQKRGDPEAREELLSRHLRLVHHVARQVHRSIGPETEFDDLVSAGTIGVINAIDNYDPARGLAFSTFAAPRIRGAMLDDLRQWDHVPRSIRQKQRKLTAARERLRSALDRQPSDRETARELGIEVEKFWRWEADVEESVKISLDQPLDAVDGRTTPADVLADGTTGVEERVSHGEEVEMLRSELARLKDRERLVLTLYYYEELKLHQIGDILGLTESRVSQIRTQALRTLRARFAGVRESVDAA